ncbi:LapA family protein [Desulforamulus ferrireducens]|uniref:Lipopolysaccharide assembly protein A domain-containing protein n=1 Tax=Desulforamulus ferrireducens TaxID=1833852 RepID=A0A1S6IX46_9FIRM|nr:LapA family protein [Desulforamulus ferrireducens]AQS59342.1 hypothetical protein B0537_09720 [Desulforamulus ferrireducens]
MRLYIVMAIIVSILVAIFALQNAESVSIEFLAWEMSFPLALVILGAAFSGMLVAWLFSVTGFFKKTKQYAELKSYARSLEEELLKYRGQDKVK